MTLPAALTLIPLHGRILRTDASGTPAVGTVSFRIEQTLRDTSDHVLLTPTTLTATLDATGAFTISLPATDDPDVTPSGWTYVVTVTTDALADTWRISVPVATVGTLEFADIAPAVSPPALVTYVLASTVGHVGGPAGPLDASGLVPSSQVPGASPSGTVTAETAYGQTAAAGSAVLLSRGDHTHGTPPLTSSAPTTSAAGDTPATGTAAAPARSDHLHGREAFGTVAALTAFGTSSGNGTAVTLPRSDHVHGAPAISAGDVPDLSATYTTRTREGAASGVATLDASGLVTATQANSGEWYPADHGLLGWAFDASTTLAGSAILTGQVALIAVKVPRAATVGTLYIDLTSGGSALSNCMAGLYDSAGTLRGSTADQSTSWQSGGLKTMPLLTPYSAAAGRYWVGLLVGNASTTPPNVGRASSQTGMPNLNLSAANTRYGVAPGTALTALPASFTPSSIGVQNIAWWAAVS